MNGIEKKPEVVIGYKIKRSILFENDRGMALAENPDEPQSFVTWQFTEENGKRNYYWGHYKTNGEAAERDYEARVADYQRRYGVSEKVSLTSIAGQLAESDKQAARDNANRPALMKNTDKDR